ALPRRFPLGGDTDAELEEGDCKHGEPGERRQQQRWIRVGARGDEEDEEERGKGDRRDAERGVAQELERRCPRVYEHQPHDSPPIRERKASSSPAAEVRAASCSAVPSATTLPAAIRTI